jgi:hypothetical protein
LIIIWMLAGTQYQSVFWTACVRGRYMLYTYLADAITALLTGSSLPEFACGREVGLGVGSGVAAGVGSDVGSTVGSSVPAGAGSGLLAG